MRRSVAIPAARSECRFPVEPLALQLVVLCGLVALLTNSANADRPNVLLIVSEDNGPELGCYGDPYVKTPRLDQLAAEGCRFENAFVPHPVCSVSRAAFLTGLYPFQNGQIGLATHRYAMFRNWDSIPSVLKNHGYRTGMVGKLHVNPESAIPLDYRAITGSGFNDRPMAKYSQAAAKFIGESDKPFFLAVNFPDAHYPLLKQQYGLPENPLTADDVKALPFIGVDSPRLRQGAADYYNCLMRLDAGVGMVLDELDKSGKSDDTLVIYIGDHGAQFSRGKASVYEGGLRIPMLVRWPGQVNPKTVRNELVSTVDILPTVLQAAALPARASLPGRSLLPLAADQDIPWRKYLFAERTAYSASSYFPQRTIRDERYKLVLNLTPDRPNPVAQTYLTTQTGFFLYGTNAEELAAASPEIQQAYATWRNPPPVELYDLQNDPHEFRDLSSKPDLADVKTRLLGELKKFRELHNDPLLDPEKLKKLTTEHDHVTSKEKGGRYGKGQRWKYLRYLQDGEDARAARPNVLFIAIDDLRPELGCYGHGHVKSPNINRLASEGVLFRRAYCQQPLCNPSRTSVMTGMRPESIGVSGNHVYFRDRFPDVATLPQHFKSQGYTSVGIGKLYHGPFINEAQCSSRDRLDDPPSWSEPAIRFGPRYYFTEPGIAAARRLFDERNPKADPEAWQNALLFGPMTEAPEVEDSVLYDGKVGDAAIAKLRELNEQNDPFFLGVGFIKPHTPFVAPKKYWDMYDPDQIPLAENPDFPETAPQIGFHSSGEIRRYTDQLKREPFTEENRRNLKHGYLACVSHVDAQVGRVLDELDRLDLASETIVVLWGDHGYHLGEQNIWGKHTTFENTARVPLIVRHPGAKGNGSSSDALVELVDLYPTLVDLAGLPQPNQLEGVSFRAVLDEPNRKWKDAAFTEQPASGNWDRGGTVIGRSMKTDRYRYTAWIDRASGKVVARHAYDHQTDPLETKNLAADPQNEALIEQLQKQLTIGWRGASGPATEFIAQNTAAATAPPKPGISTGFESAPAGPLTRHEDASGVWIAAKGHAVVHTQHSRNGLQSLRLPGGKDRQIEWTPAKSDTQPDHLTFWYERWTKRTPWDFRIEALVNDKWQTLHRDTQSAVVGSFRNRLSLKLGKEAATKFRFTCTAPDNSGVMIDDLRLGKGDYREPAPTGIPTREVDGRVERDLFYNRMNGAANYRIPSLTATTKGTVLAVCDCRIDRGGDAPNNIDQVIRRSLDNGKTWSDVRTIVDLPGKRTAGDPSLTVDRKTGTIWLCHVYADEGVGLAGGRNEPGYGDDTFHIHLRKSDDDGVTWSKPIDISESIKPRDWFAIWTAPGVGIQDREGRLMICFSGRKKLPDGKWTATSNIAYSDDHGETWQSFKELGLGTNESQVAELDDGSYLINMRQNGGQARQVSISTDRGKTWSRQKDDPALIEPRGCQGSLLRLTSKSNGDDRNRLLFCNPASTSSRKNVTVRMSYDEGKTWPVEKTIYAGPSAYSCLTVLPNGSIGLLYERDGRRVTFTDFTVDWLTGGKDKGPLLKEKADQ